MWYNFVLQYTIKNIWIKIYIRRILFILKVYLKTMLNCLCHLTLPINPFMIRFSKYNIDKKTINWYFFTSKIIWYNLHIFFMYNCSLYLYFTWLIKYSNFAQNRHIEILRDVLVVYIFPHIIWFLLFHFFNA